MRIKPNAVQIDYQPLLEVPVIRYRSAASGINDGTLAHRLKESGSY